MTAKTDKEALRRAARTPVVEFDHTYYAYGRLIPGPEKHGREPWLWLSDVQPDGAFRDKSECQIVAALRSERDGNTYDIYEVVKSHKIFKELS